MDFASRSAEIRAVRFAVFVEEQGVSPSLEMDGWDARSRHALALAAGRPVATGRLLPDGHIGRVAVLRERRGEGVGTLVMRRLMAMAREAGMERLALSSQVRAVAFYERLGFRVCGEVYLDAGIEHVDMQLQQSR